VDENKKYGSHIMVLAFILWKFITMMCFDLIDVDYTNKIFYELNDI